MDDKDVKTVQTDCSNPDFFSSKMVSYIDFHVDILI